MAPGRRPYKTAPVAVYTSSSTNKIEIIDNSNTDKGHRVQNELFGIVRASRLHTMLQAHIVRWAIVGEGRDVYACKISCACKTSYIYGTIC